MKHMYGRRDFIKWSAFSAVALADATYAAPTAGQTVQGGIIYRTLGRTGFRIPIVSMGVMTATDPDLLRASYEKGIRHFDTAHGYQNGNSETMVGQVAKGWPRDQVIISTKVSPRAAATADEYLAKLDISLQRLQMDHVDILYLHAVKKEDVLNDERYITALKKAKQQGKTRAIGISVHDPIQELIPAAVKAGCYEVILASYNFHQAQGAEILAQAQAAQAAGVGMIAMKTMAGRFLDKEKTQPVNCAAALKWALRDSAFTTAIPGYTTFDQLEENAAALRSLDLSPEDRKSLLLAQTAPGLACDMCGLCDGQCPRGVPVADLMRTYMYGYGYGATRRAKDELITLGMGDAPPPCLDCTTCAVRCARGFDVRAKTLDIARLKDVPHEFLA